MKIEHKKVDTELTFLIFYNILGLIPRALVNTSWVFAAMTYTIDQTVYSLKVHPLIF
jgi:hypothetical protein